MKYKYVSVQLKVAYDYTYRAWHYRFLQKIKGTVDLTKKISNFNFLFSLRYHFALMEKLVAKSHKTLILLFLRKPNSPECGVKN